MYIHLLTFFFTTIGCVQAAEITLPKAQAPAGFWAHWGDGFAELNGYEIKQPRYGEQRSGEAILVFVTETFTEQQRVKSDGGHSDEYSVMKLNDIRDFQTGVYDYNAMTSSFVRLDGHDPVGRPTKVSFSMQEWCGHVWDQWSIDNTQWTRTGHSYFDGEADVQETGQIAERTVFADALPIWIRGITGDWLQPDQTQEISLIPKALYTRMQHRAPSPITVLIQRSKTSEIVTVPAGTFPSETYTLTHNGKTHSTYTVESAHPHRLLQWTASDGGTGQLTGTTRMKYWQRTGEGDEGLRAQLGLTVSQTP